MCVTPAAMASSIRSAGKVLETATRVTSARLRPARSQACTMRCSTAARLSAIDMASLDRPPVPPIDVQIRETIGLFVAGAQCMADREARKTGGQHPGFGVERHEILMFHSKLAEHLVHQQ